jgi:mono/diheme cytochrome c family protein
MNLTFVTCLSACSVRAAIFFAALGLSAALASADPISHGKALVEVNCARCHAVGRTDKSSHPDAPAFRVLSQRYPLTDLEEALAEGISTGHPDMPEWVASPDQIEAIIAYIGSLQP